MWHLYEQKGINIVGPSNAEPPPRPSSPAMYQLDIVLKKGNNLAIRDRTDNGSEMDGCRRLITVVAVTMWADRWYLFKEGNTPPV
ncbi:hypothetical protein F7725_012755 [Dissostichus mawsoni]|uniref:Uncharacterized protein n=1 Tax=Dissostichus mawsoni TaxID=36200 RepID=A0A7J5YPC3_DISMA|nr:hypothetical protein F7725_012755 [Dissostichus mawsoni]